MFARYVSYVDTTSLPAFLWSRTRGIIHANSSAWEWTHDLVQSEILEAAAEDSALSGKAQIQDACGTPFLLLPLIDPRQRTDYVVGVANAGFPDVPLLLHKLHENLRYFAQTIHLLPQAVLTARPDGRFDYASRRWFQLTGAESENFKVGESLLKASGRYAPLFQKNWAAGVAGGELFAFEIPLNTTRGERWFELRAAPSYEGSHLRKWVVTIDDVHERVEARNEVTRARARLSALADIGVITLDHTLSDERRIERSLTAASNATPSETVWCLRAAIDGRKMVFTVPPSSVVSSAVFDESRKLSGIVASFETWSDGDRRPVLRAPLDAGGSGDGVLIVVGAPGAGAFDKFDVDFVRDVAWRIATAIRNATTYRRESRVARVLQTAMLPVSLPRTSSLSFDVSYVAAEAEMLIGGDWYDAFELPDGRIAFSIGDVAGHGLDAAVVMGHVREIVRMLALCGSSPAEVMTETNGVVIGGNYGLITSILAYLDPATFLIEYACAGHAPPLRVEADGTVESLEVGDVILGAVPRARYRTQTLRLHNNSALVLYTDGLVEYDHDAIAGEARLHEALAEWARSGFKKRAGELAEHVLNNITPADDAAMLIARLHHSAVDGYVRDRRTPARSAADSRS